MSSSIFSLLQMQLTQYVIPTIIILGNIGNVFIVIFFSRRRRQNSCSTFLLWAAVMNSGSITFNISYIFYSLNHEDLTIRFLAFCKLRSYIPQVFGQTARYLIVLACIDRYALTTNYAHFRGINRPLVTRCLVGIVFIFWCIFLSHLIIFTTISNGQCGQFGVYYILYFVHLMTFVCLFPIAFMAVFGFLAYRNMRRLHIRVQPIGTTSNGSTVNAIAHRRDRELLLMVFAEAVIYIVTTLPYPSVILEIAVTNLVGVSKTTERRQIESFFVTLSSGLLYLNSSSPFYTYLAVSRAFRKDFKKLFTGWKCRAVGRINPMGSQRTAQLQS